MVISKHDAVHLPDIALGTGVLQGEQETKYLGVFLLSHNGLRVNIDLNYRQILVFSACYKRLVIYLSQCYVKLFQYNFYLF